MIKYVIIALFLLLPIALVAQEVTVPVGGQEVKIVVEENNITTEVAPQWGEDAVSEEVSIDPDDAVELAKKHGKLEQDNVVVNGQYEYIRCYTYAIPGFNPVTGKDTLAYGGGTNITGTQPVYFLDLDFRARRNQKLRLGNTPSDGLSQGSNKSDYISSGTVAAISIVTSWDRGLYSKAVRAMSSHSYYGVYQAGFPLYIRFTNAAAIQGPSGNMVLN